MENNNNKGRKLINIKEEIYNEVEECRKSLGLRTMTDTITYLVKKENQRLLDIKSSEKSDN